MEDAMGAGGNSLITENSSRTDNPDRERLRLHLANLDR